ncbi:hypothetical protein WICPIJ_009048 [Wickerhamomyces pijperi]|uniref:Uncharacterized protein n=1 Tax=Wickerhamomyces pijperi TaxID=599730 RepID=A0A9P8TFC3_WICPI|nr:hypothetical protein WICPIJ_009048 [Wickerhamomyces pijperi]
MGMADMDIGWQQHIVDHNAVDIVVDRNIVLVVAAVDSIAAVAVAVAVVVAAAAAPVVDTFVDFGFDAVLVELDRHCCRI